MRPAPRWSRTRPGAGPGWRPRCAPGRRACRARSGGARRRCGAAGRSRRRRRPTRRRWRGGLRRLPSPLGTPRRPRGAVPATTPWCRRPARGTARTGRGRRKVRARSWSCQCSSELGSGAHRAGLDGAGRDAEQVAGLAAGEAVEDRGLEDRPELGESPAIAAARSPCSMPISTCSSAATTTWAVAGRRLASATGDQRPRLRRTPMRRRMAMPQIHAAGSPRPSQRAAACHTATNVSWTASATTSGSAQRRRSRADTQGAWRSCSSRSAARSPSATAASSSASVRTSTIVPPVAAERTRGSPVPGRAAGPDASSGPAVSRWFRY